MNKKIIIIIAIVLIILLAVGIYFGIRINTTNKYEAADIYTVKGEEITSVKAAIGEIDLKKYSYSKGDTETLVLTFKDSNKEENATKYIQYLKDNGNYIEMRTEDTNKQQLAKSAENSEDLVTVETDIIDDGFEVIIIVGPGTIQLDAIE